MTASYTKLFSSIVTSTVWMEDNETRILWITMLALADKDGEVHGSIPGLARIAGISIEGCRAAITKFLSPDKDSRTKEDEGRRIIEIDGGWQILNHSKYRRMASKEDQIERATERTRRWRARRKASMSGDGLSTGSDGASAHVDDISTDSDSDSDSDSDAEPDLFESEDEKNRTGAQERTPPPKEPKRERSKRATRIPDDWQPAEDLRTFASDLGLNPEGIAASFSDYWRAVPGSKGTKLDWDATWRNWCRRQAERSGGSPQGFRSAGGGGGDAAAFARAADRLDRRRRDGE